MKNSIAYSLMAGMALLATSVSFTSCEKVSPQGVLMSNTSVDDRVKQSLVNYSFYEMAWDKELPDSIQEYSFLVGSDSHITYDPGRLEEMLDICIDEGDLFCCHLGDFADTKAEYYYNTEQALYYATKKWKEKYLEVYYELGSAIVDTLIYIDPRTKCLYRDDDLSSIPVAMPFYPVVGNHDITHNGWALYNRLFKTSFYEFTVKVGEEYDRFIFLDSANGTLGNFQIEQIEDGVFWRDKKEIRNTFTFTHTNIFRPSYTEFASTYCREELYYLLDKLADWNTTIAFWGHVHAWDDRNFGDVRHITMNSMNFVDHPNGGDNLLVRVTVKKNGEAVVEPVGLYCKERTRQELKDAGFYVNTK